MSTLGNKAARAADKSRSDKDDDSGREISLPFEVPLLHQRWRNSVQILFMVPLPIYLVAINMPDPGAGTERPAAVPGIGFWVLCAACAVALAFGARALMRLVRSFLRAPGTIAIRSDRLQLPRSLAAASAILEPADLKHAYFIRRALFTTATGPILVIETSKGIFEYPRDWFDSDADQRRVATAVQRLTPRAK